MFWSVVRVGDATHVLVPTVVNVQMSLPPEVVCVPPVAKIVPMGALMITTPEPPAPPCTPLPPPLFCPPAPPPPPPRLLDAGFPTIGLPPLSPPPAPALEQ